MLRYGLLGLNDLSSLVIFSIPYSFFYLPFLQILIPNSIPIQYLFLKIIFSISHRPMYCPQLHWCEVIHGGTGKLLMVLSPPKMTIPLLATITYINSSSAWAASSLGNSFLLLCFKMLGHYAEIACQWAALFCAYAFNSHYYTQKKEFHSIPPHPLALSPFPSLPCGVLNV